MKITEVPAIDDESVLMGDSVKTSSVIPQPESTFHVAAHVLKTGDIDEYTLYEALHGEHIMGEFTVALEPTRDIEKRAGMNAQLKEAILHGTPVDVVKERISAGNVWVDVIERR